MNILEEIMQLNDFYFELPQELIAQTPLADRSSSRLLLLDKKSGAIEHKIFSDIIDLIDAGDCIVLNDTRVIPARLIGERKETGAKIEFLLLKRLSKDSWETLVNPGKKAKVAEVILFGDGILSATIDEVTTGGNRVVTFHYEGIFEEILDRLGEMPLPPYITETLEDKERYQTVYAKNEGSAAAPTAGLHFTEELLNKIADKGVSIAKVTLHVGLGTFRPVKVDNIWEHTMHAEYYELQESQAEIINSTKRNNGKIIAIGTTSCRTLESCADENGFVQAKSGQTDIFIYPGYTFKIIDSLITNFHLPESTLIMLVSALAGRESILTAYETAVKNKYRFFSFGDAMMIKDTSNI